MRGGGCGIKKSRICLNDAHFSIELELFTPSTSLVLLLAMATSLIDRVIGNEDIAFHIASFLCPRRNPSTLTEFYLNECFVSKVCSCAYLSDFHLLTFSALTFIAT